MAHSTRGTSPRTEAGSSPGLQVRLKRLYPVHSDVSLLEQAEVPQISSVQRGCCSAAAAYWKAAAEVVEPKQPFAAAAVSAEGPGAGKWAAGGEEPASPALGAGPAPVAEALWRPGVAAAAVAAAEAAAAAVVVAVVAVAAAVVVAAAVAASASAAAVAAAASDTAAAAGQAVSGWVEFLRGLLVDPNGSSHSSWGLAVWTGEGISVCCPRCAHSLEPAGAHSHLVSAASV